MSRPTRASGAPGGTPPEGALEEVDGTPLRRPAGRPRPTAPWHRAAAAALARAATRPDLWAYALVAFLARGGAVVVVLPMVVVPTFIGLVNAIGPASVTPGGLSPRLLDLLFAAAVAGGAAVLAGTIVAAAAETALHRASVDPGTEAGSGGAPPGAFATSAEVAGAPRATLRVVAVRLVLLAPVAAALVLAVPAWIQAGYHELTLPGDLAVPFLVRVLAGAPVATLAVVLAWLATEIAGGFATRRIVLFGASALGALGGGLVDPFRAPLGTLLTSVAAIAISVAALLPAAWAVGAAWETVRGVLVDDPGSPAAIAPALALAAAWTLALALAGVAAAARALLMTAELLRRGPAGPGPAGEDAASPSASPAQAGHDPRRHAAR